eukprot:11159999-Lingulodinium_polyedra.AAC.1
MVLPRKRSAARARKRLFLDTGTSSQRRVLFDNIEASCGCRGERRPLAGAKKRLRRECQRERQCSRSLH